MERGDLPLVGRPQPVLTRAREVAWVLVALALAVACVGLSVGAVLALGGVLGWFGL